MKAKWKHQAEDHESDATPDAFREWIERTTSGEVLANDAMQPDKYTQELIDHLNEVLG